MNNTLIEKVFTKKKYSPKNEKNCITVFSSLPALGDKIMITSILQKYEQDNPDEIIIYMTDSLLNGDDFEGFKEMYGAKKFFWATDSDYAIPYENAILFNVPMEAQRIAKKCKIYPILPFGVGLNKNFAKGLYLGEHKYITVSLRNLKHKKNTAWKNVTQDEVDLIFDIFYDFVYHEYFSKIVIVGNDEPIYPTVHDRSIVVDKRNQHSLSEISFIIQNSLCHVGKDSGLLHLAGVSRVPIFGWNYEVNYWMPILRDKKKGKFLLVEEEHSLQLELYSFLADKL